MRKPVRIATAGLASLMAAAGFVAAGYGSIYHPVQHAPAMAAVQAPAQRVTPAPAEQPSTLESAVVTAGGIVFSLLDEEEHEED